MRLSKGGEDGRSGGSESYPSVHFKGCDFETPARSFRSDFGTTSGCGGCCDARPGLRAGGGDESGGFFWLGESSFTVRLIAAF